MSAASEKMTPPSRFGSPMRLARWLVANTCRDGVVQGGPFAGMRYVPRSSFIDHIPVMLGCYERELADTIGRVTSESTGPIINVGAAEGYYAVGLARLARGRRVIAFEMDEKGRTLIAENAMLNDVRDAIEVRGRCDRGELESLIGECRSSAVFMDVEGAEADLFFGELNVWKDCVILVETHEFVHRGITERIRRWFESSHSCQVISQRARTSRDLPRTLPLRRLLWRWYRTLLSERRPEEMQWLVLAPFKQRTERNV